MAPKLDNVRLLVDRFDDCFRFYRDVLGLEVSWGREGGDYASFDAGDGRGLAIFVRGHQAKAVGTEHLPTNVMAQDRFMLVFSTGDLDATCSELEDRGAEFITGPESHPEWGIRTAYLRDPDGTLVEINTPLPKEAWDRTLVDGSEESGN